MKRTPIFAHQRQSLILLAAICVVESSIGDHTFLGGSCNGTLYFQHEPQLLAIAEKEAWNYLVRFGAWDFEPGESFPCGKVLTGEWYIGTISLEDDEQIYGSIEMRFTAYYQSPTARMPVDDYLSMDCFFYYDPEADTFAFDCFNTSAI